MKPPDDTTPTPSSWRQIDQKLAPRSTTSISRKRNTIAMLKLIAIGVAAALCIWGAIEIYTAWHENPTVIKAPVKNQPLKTISLRTDGVLDREWIIRTLALPKNIDMMELNLSALRDRLLANRQIRAAVLNRQLPDTLVIAIEERTPVARIYARLSADGAPETLLVARDGVIFPGANFKQTLLDTLPWLVDAILRHDPKNPTQLVPLEGIDTVSELVSTARASIPNLYATWQAISLKHYGDDRTLIVNAANGLQIIFGSRDDFIPQIARLDYIMDNLDQDLAAATRGPLRTINLAVGKTANDSVQVPVTFENSSTQTTPTRPRR